MPAVRKSKLMEVFWRIHPWLYRKTGGRVGGTIGRMPVLLLTTTGRRSGAPRTRALLYLPKGEAAVVIASYAGEPRHPDWWLNLKANPRARVEKGRQALAVVAREAEGAERERLWREMVAADAAFTVYQTRTARRIPVVVLEPGSRG